MTQNEKITELKSVIEKLYCNEGKSKLYISNLLEVDRKTLTNKINEWNLVQAPFVPKLTPSNQKFANKHKQEIINGFSSKKTITQMARELKVTPEYLNNIIVRTPELKQLKDKYIQTIGQVTRDLKEERQEYYSFNELPGEIWKPIIYHEGYFVSNKGRIKNYIKRYDCYNLLSPYPNINNGRLYIRLGDKNLQVSRIVGFAFVEGWSEENNTIDHIDGNVQNNCSDNLRWVNQAQNNKYAYDNGRRINKPYQKYGHFKKILINNKYEFKTIEAAAKFVGVSTVQFNRYYDEKKSNYNIEFIY